jgi:hypothetical protein
LTLFSSSCQFHTFPYRLYTPLSTHEPGELFSLDKKEPE